MIDSVHTSVQVLEVVHLARIEVDPVGHMEVDLEVDCTEVALGYPVVVRTEVDSEADPTEAADDFPEVDHIAVAFEVVRNSLDSKFVLDSEVVHIEDVHLLGDWWHQTVRTVVDFLEVDRKAEWQEVDRMMVGAQEAVRREVDSLAVDRKEVDLPAADHSVVDLQVVARIEAGLQGVDHIEAGLQEVVRTAADLLEEVHTSSAIVVDHIAHEEGDPQSTPPAQIHDRRDCL